MSAIRALPGAAMRPRPPPLATLLAPRLRVGRGRRRVQGVDELRRRLCGERLEAILQACLAELPLAALCAFVAYDVERAQASVSRLVRRP